MIDVAFKWDPSWPINFYLRLEVEDCLFVAFRVLAGKFHLQGTASGFDGRDIKTRNCIKVLFKNLGRLNLDNIL